MPYVIRSYEGQSEWGSDKWLAHMNLGSDIYMSFFGPTKADAEKRARDWYDNERKRYERIDPSSKPVAETGEGWGNVGEWKSAVSGPVGGKMTEGRGQHFVGKIWMVNKSTGDKKRIDPTEQSLYEGRGYVRGGPRS